MADRIKFAVSAIPLETLTSENNTSHDILASEVGRSLSGSGDSIDLDGFEDAASTQGYLNAAPYYIDAVHTAGGTVCISGLKDFVFIKNTGRFFSTTSSLGLASTHAVSVAIRVEAYQVAVESGWVLSGSGLGQIHFIEIAYLKPGQAIVLPLGSGITQFGSNANDFSLLGSTSPSGVASVYVKTVTEPGGSVPTDGNAVEFLAVD